MADLDSDLSNRLLRLTEAVPVSHGRLDPVHRGAVQARQRVRMAWVTPLAVLVVGAMAFALLGPGLGGLSGISAATRSGDFELTIRSAQTTYTANETIQIEASLVYDGPLPSVRIGHGGCAARGPIGFGIAEPVIGALHLSTVCDQARHSTVLERGRPLTVAFAKGAASSGGDPLLDLYTDYLMDPVLRLSPGTWHPSATAAFEAPDGPVSLTAAVEIDVTPDPSAEPAKASPFANGAITDSQTSGDFVLAMRSAKAVYAADEPIQITAALTYIGPDSSTFIGHASGARGGPLGFGIDEPVLGGLVLGPGWRQSCVGSNLNRDIALDQDFWKAASWSGDDPRAAAYHDFIVSSGLRLPEGTWHVYAVAEFSVGQDCTARPHTMRVDLEIQVRSVPSATPTAETPEATPPPDPIGQINSTWEGDYQVELRSDKRIYRESDAIGITGTFRFMGDGPADVSAFRPLMFSIREPVYDMRVNDAAIPVVLICISKQIEVGEEITAPFHKGSSMLGIQTRTVDQQRFLDDPLLKLPPGTWHVRVESHVSAPDCRPPATTVSAEIEITVLPDDAEQIPLLTWASRSQECRKNRHVGQLVLNEQSGMGINLDGTLRAIRWPYGFSAWDTPAGVLLLDELGHVVALEGQLLTLDAMDEPGWILSATCDVRGLVLVDVDHP